MTACPTASALLAFALGEGRSAAVAEHLDGCEDCAGFVADVAGGGDREDGEPASGELLCDPTSDWD